MSNGNHIEIRAQIDTETFEALVALNGGGALALLSVLTFALSHSNKTALAHPVLIGILILLAGLICAVVHNHLRWRCSLAHDQGRGGAAVCWWGRAFMWLSLGFFVIGIGFAAVVGLQLT